MWGSQEKWGRAREAGRDHSRHIPHTDRDSWAWGSPPSGWGLPRRSMMGAEAGCTCRAIAERQCSHSDSELCSHSSHSGRTTAQDTIQSMCQREDKYHSTALNLSTADCSQAFSGLVCLLHVYFNLFCLFFSTLSYILFCIYSNPSYPFHSILFFFV